jgi:hypothetical protein
MAVLLTGLAICQTQDSAPVEAAVKALFDAIHHGDLDAVRQLFSKDGRHYLPGGAAGPATELSRHAPFASAKPVPFTCDTCR